MAGIADDIRQMPMQMPEAQKYIYYASAESRDRAAKLPQIETLREKGFYVLVISMTEACPMQKQLRSIMMQQQKSVQSARFHFL